MKRFIITGTPGSGKTTILRKLEVNGFSVVEEAATDVIALQHFSHIAGDSGPAAYLTFNQGDMVHD